MWDLERRPLHGMLEEEVVEVNSELPAGFPWGPLPLHPLLVEGRRSSWNVLLERGLVVVKPNGT